MAEQKRITDAPVALEQEVIGREKGQSIHDLAAEMINRLDNMDDPYAHNEEKLPSRREAFKLIQELVSQADQRGLKYFEICLQDDVDGLAIVEFTA